MSGEGRPCTRMGIRGALGPVGYSDPSLRDSRSQLARLEIHSPGSFVVPNVPNPGNNTSYSKSFVVPNLPDESIYIFPPLLIISIH